MKTYYSIISFMNSHVTEEKVSIGLLMFDNERMIIQFSTSKQGLVNKLSPQSTSLLKYAVENIKAAFKHENQNTFLHDGVNHEFITYLNRYEQGILHFSAPNFYNQRLTEDLFLKCFNSWISPTKERKAAKSSNLRNTIDQELILPLKDKIDTNYKIEANTIDGLITDYRIDTIGVNGSIYASNALDITRPTFNNKLFEFESFLETVIPFLEKKVKEIQHKKENIVLFVQRPEKNSEYEEKYDRLMNKNKLSYVNNYKVDEISNLAKYRNKVELSNARKLSKTLVQ